MATNFSITFLQTVKVANSYWFAHLHFLLTNNHSSHQQFVKILQFYHFPPFKGYKKINKLNLKQNIQAQKIISPTTKISNNKAKKKKKIKPNQPILPKTNNLAL